MIFSFGGGTFTEAQVGQNLDPPGFPYQGHADTALDDTYPSSLNGLVYLSGSLQLYALDAAVIQGAVVVGTTVSSQTGAAATLTYNPAYLDNPPPGFQKSRTMEVVQGSYRRNVD